MAARHFFDDSETPLLGALRGLSLLNPELTFNEQQKALYLAQHDRENRVALISGGGAGHEPAHAGYVGSGMLTAAVSGSIFASPSAAQIVSTASRVGGKAGTILIIKNYTGDVFHFHLAAEKIRAATGHRVQVLVIGDDVAVGRARSGKVGRRGLAGTVLVHKILGAMSAAGESFDRVLAMGKLVAANLVTVGASLGHVHLPGLPKPSTQALGDDVVELGMGIHNEPGCRVLSPQPPLLALVSSMLDQLLNTEDPDRSYVDFQGAEQVVLLVNNLGGVSQFEFGAIVTTVLDSIHARGGIQISRILAGTFMTSLDGPGFSITLLKATDAMIQYLDRPTAATGWVPARTPASADNKTPALLGLEKEEVRAKVQSNVLMDVAAFKAAASTACHNVIAAEPKITQADTLVGDGDCGLTLARGARAVLAFLQSPKVEPDAVATFLELVEVIENNMDGTSGAMYSIFFAAMVSQLRERKPGSLQQADWVSVVSGALAKLQEATPARQGDRTMMDALEPFVRAMQSGAGLGGGVAKAREGVSATKGMRASLGRTIYVEERAWALVTDPGAEGVLSLLEGIESALEGE